MSEKDSILIAAASGRALAAAARQSGYRPLVVDFFGDADTRALAAATVQVADAERGFAADEILSDLHALAVGEAPIGVVYGSGLEDRPEILDIIAQDFLVCGNDAEVVAKAKNPRALSALCAELGIPHPEISIVRSRDPENWLIKRHGGGGGIHIRAGDGDAGPEDYYQHRVGGLPVSILLLADGRAAQVLGASSQWTAPSAAMPFRFGGAVRPALCPEERLVALAEAARTIAVALGLVGLNSIDFLDDADTYHLLEINPRPGATLDIFADAEGALFAAHLAASRGHLPRRPLVFTKAAATAIAYAPFELPMPALVWPDWCKDRQRPGTFLRAGDPVCTVSAEAETADVARALVGSRLALFEDHLSREAQKECVA